MTLKIWQAFCLVLALCSGQLAAAPDPASPGQTQAELARLQARIDALEKDLQASRSEHDKAMVEFDKLKNEVVIRSQYIDSRMYDFSVITNMLGNKTATVGNFIAATAMGITLLVFAAGFATYFSSKERAKKEARGVAKKWFSAKAIDLEKEIEKLLAKAEAAQESIASHAHKVLNEAQDASKTMQEAKAQAEAFMQLSNAKDPSGGLQNAPDAAASGFVQQANENLKNKAEKDFTPDEHYIRGASLYHSGNLQAALDSFDAAISHADAATSSDQVKYRMAKAFTLDALHRDDEANAIYDELDHDFGQDPQDSVREQVAIGLFNKGISLGELGRFEEAINIYDYLDYRYGEDTAPAVREQVMKGLFNKGSKLGKLGRVEEEIAAYDYLDQRFGTAQTSNVHTHMVQALNRLGVSKITDAKANWLDMPMRQELLKGAMAVLDRALGHCVPPEKALMRSDQYQRAEVMGHTGYCLALAGERKDAREHTLEALKLGGEELLLALRELVQTQRLEAEDSQFEKLLDEAMHKLS
jgi:tetratricopeptide (TPR) repeat protein